MANSMRIFGQNVCADFHLDAWIWRFQIKSFVPAFQFCAHEFLSSSHYRYLVAANDLWYIWKPIKRAIPGIGNKGKNYQYFWHCCIFSLHGSQRAILYVLICCILSKISFYVTDQHTLAHSATTKTILFDNKLLNKIILNASNLEIWNK